MAQRNLNPSSALFFTLVLLSLLGVLAWGILESTGRRGGTPLLLGATVVLTALTILSGFSVGLFFAPAALLAWGALLVRRGG